MNGLPFVLLRTSRRMRITCIGRGFGAVKASDFDVTGGGLQHASNIELIRGWCVLKLCSLPSATNMGIRFLSLSRGLIGISLTDFLLKKTIYAHFCGGETEKELQAHLKKLKLSGISPILDYLAESVAADQDPDVNMRHTERFIDMLGIAQRMEKDSARPPFMGVKLSAFVDRGVIERFACLMHDEKGDSLHPNDMSPADRLKCAETIASENDCNILKESRNRLHFMFDAAKRLNVKIMIDAEQLYLQPTIDALTDEVQREFNGNNDMVYSTYQCYLKGAQESLVSHLQHCESENRIFAVKLVRGAYLEEEKDRAKLFGRPSPVADTKSETDAIFDSCASVVINRIADKGNGRVSLATHNINSIMKSMMLWEERGLACDDGIGFAQLCGMSDNVSYPLAGTGYPVFKYLPFGSVAETVPYLLRRAQENSGSSDMSKRESETISLEIMRRAKSIFLLR